MFIVKYYLLVSILFALAAFYSPNLYFSVAFGWIALSFTAVSFAYMSDSPWIFRKNDRGNIPFYIQWVFVPFLIAVQIYNSWQRYNDSVPPVQEIKPKLFLACRLFPSDVQTLKTNEVTAILDATAEFSGMNWSADDENLDYLNIPILDHQAPHSDDLVKAINWIHNHIRNEQGVVVHCALGRGRSVLIMAAYLIAAQHAKSVDDAVKQINKIRGTARLNSYQHKKLSQMHEDGVLNLKQRALLIVNPASGGGAWEQAQHIVEQTLSQRYQLSIAYTEKDQPVADTIKEHDLMAFECLLACGGDGTVNAVAKALHDTHGDKQASPAPTFGIIPLGTTNALSQVLYASSAKNKLIEIACQAIVAGNTKDIDAATCNEHIMLLAVGIGFEHKMIAGADRKKKDELGELAYLSALFDALKENDTQSYTISIDGQEARTIEASSILVANAAPLTSLLSQGRGAPNPTDGKLDLTILNTRDSTSQPFAKLIAQAVSKGGLNLDEQADLQHAFVKNLRISKTVSNSKSRSDSQTKMEELSFAIDGELQNSSELNIAVIPGAFTMFANEQMDDKYLASAEVDNAEVDNAEVDN
ncbi:diacylglycerol kinase family protein [Glaciecola siphonariae]|uniref:Diacylglycerol kinase family protein n=1 Tax=Glaciecola siphonariae TaxID=521012 RepID=A0ABV9LYG2_9ALTE